MATSSPAGVPWGAPGPAAGRVTLGALRPDIGSMSLAEAEAFLVGLVARNLVQIRAGAPLPSPGLLNGQIRYIRRDKGEYWKPLGEVWRDGGGDCEDLAAAVAAERSFLGMPSRVVILQGSGRVAHAVVQDLRTGQLLDPSLTGGMGWNEGRHVR